MTATRPTGSATLTQRVAAEIRAEMARQRLTQRELARRLQVVDMWVSRRINAVQPLTLDELDRMTEALGVSSVDLLNRAEESRRRPSALQPAHVLRSRKARAAAGPRRPRRLYPSMPLAA